MDWLKTILEKIVDLLKKILDTIAGEDEGGTEPEPQPTPEPIPEPTPQPVPVGNIVDYSRPVIWNEQSAADDYGMGGDVIARREFSGKRTWRLLHGLYDAVPSDIDGWVKSAMSAGACGIAIDVEGDFNVESTLRAIRKSCDKVGAKLIGAVKAGANPGGVYPVTDNFEKSVKLFEEVFHAVLLWSYGCDGTAYDNWISKWRINGYTGQLGTFQDQIRDGNGYKGKVYWRDVVKHAISGKYPFTLLLPNHSSQADLNALAAMYGSQPTPTPTPNPKLELGASSRTFSADATSWKELKVTSNVSWTVSSNVNWLTPKTTSGNGDAIIYYDVSANTSASSRTGKMTVSGGGLSKIFTVTQNGGNGQSSSSSSSSNSSTTTTSSNGNFTPPTRRGTDEWTGNGKFNTYKDAGRANEKSSSKVVVSGWFNVNAWSGGNSSQPAGFAFADKGKVGSHWGLFLAIRPDGLVWGSTKGEIVAPAKVYTGVWYHVKAEATSSSVKMWLDGKLLKNNEKTFSGNLIQDSGEPLRLGGYHCPWSNATWFNQSLIGKISDMEIEMK